MKHKSFGGVFQWRKLFSNCLVKSRPTAVLLARGKSGSFLEECGDPRKLSVVNPAHADPRICY